MLEIVKGLICSFIQTLSLYLSGYLIFKDKRKTINKKKIIISFSISIILYYLDYLFLPNTLKSLLMCFHFSLTIIMFFNISILKSLFFSIIYMVILFIPDLLVLTIMTSIFNINKNYFYEKIAGSILGSFLVNILMVLIIFIIKKQYKNIINYNFSSQIKIINVLFLSFITFLILFYQIIYDYRFDKNILNYIIVIITLIIILFYLFKEEINREKILKNYDNLLVIMKNYENDIEEQRIFLHETKNELVTIKSKINDNVKKEDLLSYVDKILEDKKSHFKMSKFSKLKYLPSNGLRGFIYYKLLEAEEKNINISLNVSSNIKCSFISNLSMSNFKDLVRILGIYLDNAIYASSNSISKRIGIEIYMVGNNIEIIISNTFNEKIDIEKIGREKYSTKGGTHGYGLLLAEHILNHCNMFESKKCVKNNIYIQTIIIKNK